MRKPSRSCRNFNRGRTCLGLLVALCLTGGCSDGNSEPKVDSTAQAVGTAEQPRLPTVTGVEPGSKEPRFTLEMPDGFEWSSKHRLYHNNQLRTTIRPTHSVGVEIQTVVDDFAAADLKTFEVIDKEIVNVDNRPTLLLHANRRDGKYPQQVCVVAYGTKTGCAQVTALYPTDAAESLKKTLEKSLLNSRYEFPE